MKIQRFEDAIAWQKARELVNLSYRELQGCRDFTFRDQFLRAALSVMNNIAEGFERQSNKEMKQFLFISKGSCAEVRSMLYVGEEREFMSSICIIELRLLAEEIPKILRGLINTL